MDIKQEDLIKFWTWCGFKQSVGSGWVTSEGDFPFWYDPNGELYSVEKHGEPKLTLDNIYQYAIPKLQDKGYTVSLVAKQNGGFDIWIGDVTKKSIGELVESKNPTEALYNAIMKVVNNAT